MILESVVGDLALQWDLHQGAADLVLEDDDLASDEGLRTAVLLSLFVDRRAEDDDVLPWGDDARRGWRADEVAEVEGDRIGSRRWLLSSAKRTGNVAAQLEAYDREALAWMLEDKVASAIDVEVTASGHVLSEVVTIHRPSGDAVSFKFAHVWDGETANV